MIRREYEICGFFVFVVSLVFPWTASAVEDSWEKLLKLEQGFSQTQIAQYNVEIQQQFESLAEASDEDQKLVSLAEELAIGKTLVVLDSNKPTTVAKEMVARGLIRNIEDLSLIIPPAFTVGNKIYLRKDFFGSLNRNEVVFVLLHEDSHDFKDSYRLYLTKDWSEEDRKEISDQIEIAADRLALKRMSQLGYEKEIALDFLRSAVKSMQITKESGDLRAKKIKQLR